LAAGTEEPPAVFAAFTFGAVRTASDRPVLEQFQPQSIANAGVFRVPAGQPSAPKAARLLLASVEITARPGPSGRGAQRKVLAAMSLRQMFGLILALATLAAAAAPALAADDDAAAARPSAGQNAAQHEYVLGPGDSLEVQVVGRDDFNAHVRIDANGNIQVPFLGNVQASGRTAPQLGEELAKALVVGGYFAKPIMRVDIVGYASQYITVLGAVANPGLVSIDRAYHVSEILARVGGTKDKAADYVILRSPDGSERRLLIKDIATGDASLDPLVFPGDKLFSPTAEQFYVSGEVNRPGAYPLSSGMTLRMAIAQGGGLTYRGTTHAVKITRGGQVLRDVQLDDKIEPGDVIAVPERFF
jgi:polysaccharide export outer membrane protein